MTTIVIGVILAIVAVAIVGAVVIVSSRPKHRNVRVIEDPVREAAAAEPDDDGGSLEPNVTPAPLLPPEPTAKWHPKDGGVADPCAALQRALERDAGADLVSKLDAKCRAAKKPKPDPGF